jgi:glycosyltransferase involved in cell wall biosynthesis
MKKRILFCTESGDLSTGYGNYTRSILSRLYDTDKYDIAELSCYKTTSTANKFPWKIYPNAVDKNDPRYHQYNSVLQNQFGQWRFDLVVAHFKPDIVIDFRDIFMSLFQRTSVFRNKFQWILAPTIDSFPIRSEWIDSLNNCDILLTHTNWAKTQIEDNYGIKVYDVVQDSIDTSIYRPLNKYAIRQAYGLSNPNALIIGSVMRNQKRKLIPELIRIMSTLIQNNNSLYLYLHTSYPELSGWDIPKLLIEYDVYHRVLFSYICKECQHFVPMLWKGEVYQCPKCHKQTLVLSSSSKGVNDETLCKIYNMFDIYIQYAICEGFGIPPLEAAACGIPFITVNHGAMKELGQNFNADLVDISQYYREQENSSDRVYPDNFDCINKIQSFINKTEIERIKLKEKYRAITLNKYSWDLTAKKFESIIESTPNLKPERWIPISDSHFQSINKDTSHTRNNRETIYSVVDRILEEPKLKDSFFVQSIVKAVDQGYIVDGEQMMPYTLESAIKTLEMWFNNKIFLNKFLEDHTVLKNQDFLHYTN